VRSNLSPTGCREHLDRLLTEEVSELERLEGVLEREHGFISDNSVDQLTAAGKERQGSVSALFRIEDERRELCRMMDVDATPQGIEELLTWCDPSRSLLRRWAGCFERAKRCRNLNDRNGALVSARLKRVEGLLGFVTRQSQGKSTYNKAGAYQGLQSGRVVATKA
jgi:flagellar biosynthesis protein FlgN